MAGVWKPAAWTSHLGVLQVAVGFYDVAAGTQMLVAPHEFAAALSPYLPFAGVLLLLGGAGLLAGAVVAPSRALLRAQHLAGGAATWVLAWALLASRGGRVAAVLSLALGVVVMAAPFLLREEVTPAESRLSSAMGAVVSLPLLLALALLASGPVGLDGHTLRLFGFVLMILALAAALLVGRTTAGRERDAAEGERARLLAELQASQERYRNFFDGTGEALLVLDQAGRYIDVNHAAVELTGYSADELRQMQVGNLSTSADTVRAAWPTISRRAIWQGAAVLRRRDGSQVPVETLLKPVDLASETVYVSAMRDVSQQRAALRQHQDFIAMVGHELRNPLTAIEGYATLVQRRGVPDPHSCERIIEQTRQLDRLVGDLLDTNQLESGRLRLQLQPTDLLAVMRGVAEETARLGTRHQVRWRLPEGRIEGTWDPDRVAQVLRNLISNALKYSPEGGEILIEVEQRTTLVQVSITDQGAGIAADCLPRIFDRFYRAPGSDGGARGLGVGLYVCQQLVQGHGGRLEVRSELGLGSTFTFSLPGAVPRAEIRLG